MCRKELREQYLLFVHAVRFLFLLLLFNEAKSRNENPLYIILRAYYNDVFTKDLNFNCIEL